MRKGLRACGHHWSRTTFKREMAMISFACWLVFVHGPTVLLAMTKDPSIVTAYSANYSIATTMIWGFILSAFGADWWSKQMQGPTTVLPPGGPT